MRLPRLVLALFLVAQAYDGLFTLVAVEALGPAAEGNVILGSLMTLLGPGPTLVAAKSLAVAAGLFVYWRGLVGVLGALTIYYLAGAIGPWMYVYATWP